ncbi:hypothetical protein [Undibacterium fentianense]|uniref:hypothetical protein n=1 Tax=Undibacterium fentianense TaxID=2828728 RepID=UPI002E2FE0C4|nr:hypothetical protein [Undibacterium fentianense]
MLADRLDGNWRLRALSWLNGTIYTGWLAGLLLARFTLGWGLAIPFWIAVISLCLTALMVAFVLPIEEPSNLNSSWWHVARSNHAFNLLKIHELRQLFVIQFS